MVLLFYTRGAFRCGAILLHGLGSYRWFYYFRPSALNAQKEKDNQCSQISLRAPNRARVHCMPNPHGSLTPFNSPVTCGLPTPLYGCQDQGQQMILGKDHMWVSRWTETCRLLSFSRSHGVQQGAPGTRGAFPTACQALSSFTQWRNVFLCLLNSGTIMLAYPLMSRILCRIIRGSEETRGVGLGNGALG